MTKTRLCCLTLSLPFAFAGTAFGDAPEDARDANGRSIESVDGNGVRIVYIYDAQGNLQEARYEDGSVEHFTPVLED